MKTIKIFLEMDTTKKEANAMRRHLNLTDSYYTMVPDQEGGVLEAQCPEDVLQEEHEDLKEASDVGGVFISHFEEF